jgi:vanillate O-demethylase monooxygenase subunit
VDDVPPSAHSRSYHRFTGNVDRRFLYDFVLPGTLLMHSGTRPTGQPEADWSGGTTLHSCQALTPETETSTHYFFQQAYRAETPDPEVVEKMYQGLVRAFEEDRDMITAQFRNIQRSPSTPMLPLAMDSALIRFRRLLDSELRKEAEAGPPTSGRPITTIHLETQI